MDNIVDIDEETFKITHSNKTHKLYMMTMSLSSWNLTASDSSAGGYVHVSPVSEDGQWPTDAANTTDTSGDGGPPRYTLWQAILIAIACSLIIIGTVVGNVLVCIAVAIVRKLRTPSNLLIVSLAVADLLVALLVMPLALTYEVFDEWVHGQTMCDAWTSLDVMLCTASILNLCMISVDRYFVITRPFQYAIKRTPRRMLTMIVCVWMSAALVSIPPLFGWKSEPKRGQCVVSQSIGYQFYATIGSFYIPLTVMIVIYSRIYLVSARIARQEAKSMTVSEAHLSVPSCSRKNSNICGEENHNCPDGSSRRSEASMEMLPKKNRGSSSSSGVGGNGYKPFAIFKKSRTHRVQSTSDSKATKTLGVIMGSFTACWLPFFIVALFKPLCADPENCVPHWLGSLFLWLGYANSLLNPVIYARFNRDFRTPFKEILLCRCRGINLRLRSESYVEQYGLGATTRESLRPPVNSVVRYNNRGKTVVVKVGNGNSKGR